MIYFFAAKNNQNYMIYNSLKHKISFSLILQGATNILDKIDIQNLFVQKYEQEILFE